jgi:hypothetical protein
MGSDGKDHLDILDSAIGKGLFASQLSLGDLMNDPEIKLPKVLEPVLRASILPQVWRMDKGRNPFIMYVRFSEEL